MKRWAWKIIDLQTFSWIVAYVSRETVSEGRDGVLERSVDKFSFGEVREVPEMRLVLFFQ